MLSLSLSDQLVIDLTKACHYVWPISKDAGFVYESFRIETNRVIWDFCFQRNKSTKRIYQKQTYESNSQYESLSIGFANPDLRIQNLRIRKDSDLQISIFKDSFRAIVLRIHMDLLEW